MDGGTAGTGVQARRSALRRALIVVAVVLLVGALGIAVVRTPPVFIDIVTVTEGPLRELVVEDGITRLAEVYDVTAPRTGRLGRIALETGDKVSRGDTLALLEPLPPTLLDARALAENRARIASSGQAIRRAAALAEQAAADRTLADQEAVRMRRLAASGAASTEELEKSEAGLLARTAAERATVHALRQAEDDERQARAALETGNGTTGGSEPVTAPVDGVVLALPRRSAGVVAAGEKLVTLGDPASLEVVIDVLTTLATRVRPGQRVLLGRWGGPDREGRVRYVEPQAFETRSALGVEERRVNVVVVPTGLGPADPLGEGFRVEGRIETWSAASVVRVPRSALFRDPQGWTVFAVEGGKARRRRPVVGHEGESDAEVLSGLAPGDTLVSYPTDEVQEGVRVTIRHAPP